MLVLFAHRMLCGTGKKTEWRIRQWKINGEKLCMNLVVGGKKKSQNVSTLVD